jgi:hypothetical protein
VRVCIRVFWQMDLTRSVLERSGLFQYVPLCFCMFQCVLACLHSKLHYLITSQHKLLWQCQLLQNFKYTLIFNKGGKKISASRWLQTAKVTLSVTKLIKASTTSCKNSIRVFPLNQAFTNFECSNTFYLVKNDENGFLTA